MRFSCAVASDNTAFIIYNELLLVLQVCKYAVTDTMFQQVCLPQGIVLCLQMDTIVGIISFDTHRDIAVHITDTGVHIKVEDMLSVCVFCDQSISAIYIVVVVHIRVISVALGNMHHTHHKDHSIWL